jgi:hypothetical protein
MWACLQWCRYHACFPSELCIHQLVCAPAVFSTNRSRRSLTQPQPGHLPAAAQQPQQGPASRSPGSAAGQRNSGTLPQKQQRKVLLLQLLVAAWAGQLHWEQRGRLELLLRLVSLPLHPSPIMRLDYANSKTACIFGYL